MLLTAFIIFHFFIALHSFRLLEEDDKKIKFRRNFCHRKNLFWCIFDFPFNSIIQRRHKNVVNLFSLDATTFNSIQFQRTIAESQSRKPIKYCEWLNILQLVNSNFPFPSAASPEHPLLSCWPRQTQASGVFE